MDDEVHVVDQYPVCLVIAFHLVRPDPCLLEAKLHFIRDSLNLPGIFAGADHEVISECRRVFVHFEDADLLAFLFFAGLNGGGYLASRLGIHSLAWILLRTEGFLHSILVCGTFQRRDFFLLALEISGSGAGLVDLTGDR